MDRLGKKHADKMYVDGAGNQPRHIGYVIGGRWITVYQVERMDQIRPKA
jgi:hypothetical protein